MVSAFESGDANESSLNPPLCSITADDLSLPRLFARLDYIYLAIYLSIEETAIPRYVVIDGDMQVKQSTERLN